MEKVTDALDHETRFSYDAVGRLLTQTFPDGKVLGMGYDANGNVTQVVPPGQPGHGFEYDLEDVQRKYWPPVLPSVSAPQTEYVWNLDHQLTQVIRPDGQTVLFDYDASQGRLNGVSWPGGTQTVGYDAKGRVETLTTVRGNTLTYTYDGSLVLSETWSGQVQGSVGLTYYNDFRVKSVQVRNESPILYEYDGDGLLTRAGESHFTRNVQNGLLKGTTLGGVTTEREYNGFGELRDEGAKYSGNLIYSVHYERDKLGRITQKIETVGGIATTFDYGYDLAGRLKEVKENGVVVGSYTYDGNGNRLNGNAVYDVQDRLVSANSNPYTYTANGELLTKNNVTYQYDVFGNLRQVNLPGKTVEYVIDAQNRRIGKKVNGNLVQGFLYQGSLRPVAELNGNGDVVARFVYGSKGNVPDYMLKNGRTYRIISDHLGSPRWVVDVLNGSVAQEMEFDAWGQVILDTNQGFQPFGFAGGLYDVDTGLVRFGARDYDAEVGRWTSKDPIGFAGGDSNLFGYVLGDAVNSTDPSGLAEYCGPCAGPTADTCLLHGGNLCDPGFDHKPLDGAAGVRDFVENYNNMREANTIGADKYFHCMANCEATQRGPSGESVACLISDVREWVDQNLKGDPPSASDDDQKANKHGRSVGPWNASANCRQVCASFRPKGLDQKY